MAEGAPGCPLWMVTYGDLMSLLLTFFILLVSFSDFEESSFRSTMGAMSDVKTGMNIQFKKKEYIFSPPVIQDVDNYATTTEIPKNTDYKEAARTHSALSLIHI